MIYQPQQFATYSLRRSPWGNQICRIMAAGINCADAGCAIKTHIMRDGESLIIDKLSYNLSEYQRIFIFGAGKAGFSMANQVEEILGDRITAGFVITKEGYLGQKKNATRSKVKFVVASHPIPDQRNLDAGSELLSLTQNMRSDDLVIITISGGGSSLLMHPPPGMSLSDIQNTTSLLIKCGATIAEINTIRKHLDKFKGGGLAGLLHPAKIVALILSDVVGDDLVVIASGPTVADPTTFSDAQSILNKYQIMDQIPPRVISHIVNGIQGKVSETLKPSDPIFQRVSNFVVGNNTNSVSCSVKEATVLGFNPRILTTSLEGEAAQVGQIISEDAKILLRTGSITKPACLIAGGETTVTIHGTGFGGRNQELALGAVTSLSGAEDMILASLATDGGDGPTDAAGAVVTNETYNRGFEIGLNPHEYLRMNDSYHYFEPLEDLIKTGPTLTNVNDLIFFFAF